MIDRERLGWSLARTVAWLVAIAVGLAFWTILFALAFGGKG